MYVAGVCVRKCVLYDCIFLIGFGLFNDVMSTAEFVQCQMSWDVEVMSYFKAQSLHSALGTDCELKLSKPQSRQPVPWELF